MRVALYSKSKYAAGRSKKLHKYITVKCTEQTLFTRYRNIILILEKKKIDFILICFRFYYFTALEAVCEVLLCVV